jgi:uncharacterized DUF497 family protein
LTERLVRDDEFEWDDKRAAENLTRHGVSFEAARLAFDDPFSVSREDRRKTYGEDRYSLLGVVEGRLVHVSYTFRGDLVRIVSARGAEPYEQRLYHEANP